VEDNLLYWFIVFVLILLYLELPRYKKLLKLLAKPKTARDETQKRRRLSLLPKGSFKRASSPSLYRHNNWWTRNPCGMLRKDSNPRLWYPLNMGTDVIKKNPGAAFTLGSLVMVGAEPLQDAARGLEPTTSRM
jgi:hypothetical protein